MHTHKVELSVTLYGKVAKWSKEDQIFFSAFVQCVREFSIDAVLVGFNCVIDDTQLSATGSVEELAFWMKIRMHYERFILRKPIKGLLVLSDS